MSEINNNEIPEIPQVEKAQEIPEAEKKGFGDADEDFDPEWTNPSYEDIVSQPDVTDDGVSWATSGVMDTVDAGLEANHNVADVINNIEDNGGEAALNEFTPDGLTETIQGIDAASPYISAEMHAHAEDIDNFGTGVAESMHEMNGNGITETDLFNAKSDAIANGYEEMPEETPLEKAKTDEEGDFKVEQNGKIDIETDPDTIEELKNQGYEVEMEVTNSDVDDKKDDSQKTENIESDDESELDDEGIGEELEETEDNPELQEESGEERLDEGEIKEGESELEEDIEETEDDPAIEEDEEEKKKDKHIDDLFR